MKVRCVQILGINLCFFLPDLPEQIKRILLGLYAGDKKARIKLQVKSIQIVEFIGL